MRVTRPFVRVTIKEGFKSNRWRTPASCVYRRIHAVLYFWGSLAICNVMASVCNTVPPKSWCKHCLMPFRIEYINKRILKFNRCTSSLMWNFLFIFQMSWNFTYDQFMILIVLDQKILQYKHPLPPQSPMMGRLLWCL